MNTTNIEDLLYCPITYEKFKYPVIASDGHIYEKNAILRIINTSGKSPITNESLLDEVYDCLWINKFIDTLNVNKILNQQLFNFQQLDLYNILTEQKYNEIEIHSCDLVYTFYLQFRGTDKYALYQLWHRRQSLWIADSL